MTRDEQENALKIGVDAHVLSGIFQGSRTYLYNLYRSISALDSENDYLYFGHWEGEAPFGEGVPHLDFPSPARWRRLTYQTAPLVRRYDIDLFHSTFISPLILPCRSLLTILDVLYETHPQFFNTAQRMRNKLLVRFSAGRAAQIHTISRYCRRSIIDVYGVEEERVKVVPCGIDLATFSPKGRDDSRKRILDTFGVEDYILTVGRLEPRKNHIGLLRAYSSLKKKIRSPGPLVIVGQKDFGYRSIFSELKSLNLERDVLFLENVQNDLSPHIYRAARLFVYPSFAEGFGIPALEAMASGVPVVSSDTTAMKEVVEEAGLLVDPAEPEDICDAMGRLLEDDGLHDRHAKLGRKQAEKWTWDNAARRYLDAIRAIS